MASFEGTFVESWVTKYGHAIKVTNSKGEFKFFARGPAPSVRSGQEVTFDAVKAKSGASWNYSNLHVRGRSATSAAPAVQAGEPSPAPLGSDRMMFVTGVVGRSMQSGQFGLKEIADLTLAANEAFEALMGRKTKPADPPASLPGETEERYGVPLDDEIPF